MNIRHLLGLTVCLLGAAAARTAAASEVLYDGSGFLSGQQSFVQSFNITGPGTLTVSLTNVDWPQQLASLNMVLSSGSGSLLGPEMGAGTDSFHVDGGLVYAQWFGTAQGPLDTGLYSLNVQFMPSVRCRCRCRRRSRCCCPGWALLAWQRRGRRHRRSRAAECRPHQLPVRRRTAGYDICRRFVIACNETLT